MHQKSRALIICRAIQESMDTAVVNQLLLGLSDVIGRAQNKPPDGESDGSIDERLWNRLVELRDELSGALRDLESLR